LFGIIPALGSRLQDGGAATLPTGKGRGHFCLTRGAL
jgi:hypothetical protein